MNLRSPMKTTTIANHYVRAALAGAKAKGYDTRALLQKAGMAPELLDQQKARVYPEKMAALYAVVVKAMGDEFMGHGSQPTKIGTFATFCQLVVNCKTLGEAFKTGCRFYGLFDHGVHTGFRRTAAFGELFVTQTPQALDAYHFLTETQLAFWHRIACWLTGKKIPIDAAEFAYAPPAHVSEYKLVFYNNCYFNRQQTLIRIPARCLDWPIIRNQQDVEDLLPQSPEIFLIKPGNNASISAQIRNILSRSGDAVFPDFETIAQQLNTSTQTLRRRLREENESFQDLKDQVRRDLAIYYLCQHQLSINDIALRVGFTEPSTFHRAFKKWTGVTPGIYREKELAGLDESCTTS